MRFSKWHALGNAYLLVERAELADDLTEETVRLLCDVHFGVGSDGVLEIVSVSGAEADVVVWNPDGSRAEFSGNGARIAARWLAARAGTESVRLRFGERVVDAAIRGPHVEVDVGEVRVGEPDVLDVHGEAIPFTPVSVGNQHAVLRLDFDENDAEFYGPLLQGDTRFPRGTNVQLVRVVGRDELMVSVWERGVGATLSSGSSAVAAAAAAVADDWCDSPVTVGFPQAGDVRVELYPASPRSFHARLTGAVEEVCRGEVLAR